MNNYDALLKLIRYAIGTETVSPDDGQWRKVSWSEVYSCARYQHVPFIAFDGFSTLFAAFPWMTDPSFTASDLAPVRYEWLRETVANERKYLQYVDATASLGRLYADNGIRMMLLKGYGLSLYWPVPEHRTTGDIDIYLFGRWREGDESVRQRLGVRIDDSHRHHTGFQVRGLPVENHYDFVDVRTHRSSKRIETRFKELAQTPGREILPDVYEPSPLLNLLFTIRHAACTFASDRLNLRLLLDCALLVRAHQDDVDWTTFWNDVEMMGMTSFVLAIADISRDRLRLVAGTSADTDTGSGLFHIPPHLAYKDARDLSERIFNDITAPDTLGPKPTGRLRRAVWMLRRWWRNRWKHRAVYSDSLVSSFVTQALSHLR